MPAHSCRCRLESCPVELSAAETASFSLSHEREEAGAAHGYPPPPLPPPPPPPPLPLISHQHSHGSAIDRSSDRGRSASAHQRASNRRRWNRSERISPRRRARGFTRERREAWKGITDTQREALLTRTSDPPCVNIPAPRHELYRS